MAGDIAAAADALGLDRFVLVGHSMGGGVALTYAGVHPDRVAGLLLVDPIGDGKQIPAAESESFLEWIESDYPTMIRQYWTSIAGPNSAVRERLLADSARRREGDRLQVAAECDAVRSRPPAGTVPGPIMSVVTPQNDAAVQPAPAGPGISPPSGDRHRPLDPARQARRVQSICSMSSLKTSVSGTGQAL